MGKHRFPRLAETYEVKIRTLTPGAFFYIVFSSGKMVGGRLLYVTSGSATVETDGWRKKVKIVDDHAHWDLDTMVVPMGLFPGVKRFPRLRKKGAKRI